MGPRGAGRRLNDQERMEILEIIQHEAKVKNVDLAKRYGVSEGAIRKLKQMKDTVRNRYYMGNEHNRDKRKRGGFKRNAPFEEELYQWILRVRDSHPYQLVPLTQTAVRQQAIVLAKNYDKMANFKASPGWFARFCSRHQLDPIATSVDTAAASAPVALDGAVLGADGAPQVATAPAPAVTTAEETVFSIETLTSSPVTTSEVANQVAAEEGSKTETPSINEQVQQAAREHNEAALRAAAAKIDEAQASAEIKMEKKETMTVSEVDEETEEEHEEDKTLDGAAAVAVNEDEIFSLGL